MDVERIIDYLSPAARREVLRAVRQVQEVGERCPTCRSPRKEERLMVEMPNLGGGTVVRPCQHLWHTEGEQP